MSCVLTLSSLLEFFGDEANNLIKKGESLLASNHLEAFSYDGSLQHVKAKVWASQRQLTYNVEVRDDKVLFKLNV